MSNSICEYADRSEFISEVQKYLKKQIKLGDRFHDSYFQIEFDNTIHIEIKSDNATSTEDTLQYIKYLFNVTSV